MRRLSARPARLAFAAAAGIAALVGETLFQSRASVGPGPEWLDRRRMHADAENPLPRELAAGRFAAGGRADELIAAFPPAHIETAGEFVRYIYPRPSTGDGPAGPIMAYARRGVLIHVVVGAVFEPDCWVVYRMSDADRCDLVATLTGSGWTPNR